MIEVDIHAMKEMMIYLKENFEKDSLLSHLKVVSHAIKVTDMNGDTAIFEYNTCI